MDDATRLALAATFTSGADAYERLRPPYPQALFDRMVELAGERWRGRILEVGAGTGRATLPLARGGGEVTVVEPSADMLRVLGARLEAEGLAERVTLREGTFEDVEPDGGTYDLVVAAQSFHWADPATRWPRLARLLGDDGLAFLFWNAWALDPSAHDLATIRAIYTELGGTIAPDLDNARAVSPMVAEIEAEPLLGGVDSAWLEWPLTMPVDDYLGLLQTTSQYVHAGTEVTGPLYEALRPALGTVVTLAGRTLLLTVRPSAA